MVKKKLYLDFSMNCGAMFGLIRMLSEFCFEIPSRIDAGDTMKPESVNHWLESVATEKGAKTAITFLRSGRLETEITYKQLQGDVNRFANTLLRLGVVKGDRVILKCQIRL